MVSQWFADHVPPGSSILQSGSPYGNAQLDRAAEKQRVAWDRSRRAFVVDGQAPAARPDWILVQDSPLPSRPRTWSRNSCGRTTCSRGVRSAGLNRDQLLYDRQDTFYAPFAGFGQVERPGANSLLHKRAAKPSW